MVRYSVSLVLKNVIELIFFIFHFQVFVLLRSIMITVEQLLIAFLITVLALIDVSSLFMVHRLIMNYLMMIFLPIMIIIVLNMMVVVLSLLNVRAIVFIVLTILIVIINFAVALVVLCLSRRLIMPSLLLLGLFDILLLETLFIDLINGDWAHIAIDKRHAALLLILIAIPYE